MPEGAPTIAAAPESEAPKDDVEPSATDVGVTPARGLLGRLIALRASRAEALEAEVGEAPVEVRSDAQTEVDVVATEIEAGATPVADAKPMVEEVDVAATAPLRPGLFASLFSRRVPRGATIVEPGSDLAYGIVVSSCGTSGDELGTEVARFPERGGGYRLYDTDPSSIELRSHYITVFKDGCPRRFVAALAIFGGVQAYETTRYEDGGNTTTVTETDRLYKQIRRRACGAPVGTNCPERRFNKLGRDAVFVSVYERFGTTPTWADMLIYQGEVVAKDFKSIR